MTHRCVLRGGGPAEAHLTADWLRRNGVEVQIRGEALQGLFGLLPYRDAAPSLWVAEVDAERARALIEAAAQQVAEARPWACRCGEQVDGHFGSCWSCGRDRGFSQDQAG